MQAGPSIHRLIRCMFAGAILCACTPLVLVAASAEASTNLPREPQHPPLAEPSPLSTEPPPPPLILLPAAGSAEARLDVLGQRLVSCVVVQGGIESSGNGLSAAAAGEVFVLWDGTDPVAIIHLDEYSRLSAILQIAEATSPGGHRVVSRCISADGDPGSADVTAPPPSAAGAVIPGGNPIDAGLASPFSPESTDLPKPPADAVSTFPGTPDGPAGNRTAENLSPQSAPTIPPGNASAFPLGNRTRTAADQPASPGTGPASSWGMLAGLLLLLCAGLVTPSLSSLAFQARRGPKWVRTNVRASADTAPVVGIQLTQQPEGHWPPTFAVRFALRGDSGSQALTEVDR